MFRMRPSLALAAILRRLVPVRLVTARTRFQDGMAAYQVGDYTAALKIWRPLASQGDAAAQNGLGVLYAQGGRDVLQNYTQAAKWFRLAAKQGHAAAQDNLGVLYRHGLGVPQDYTRAAHWYRLAAEQEDAAAQNSLDAI